MITYFVFFLTKTWNCCCFQLHLYMTLTQTL